MLSVTSGTLVEMTVPPCYDIVTVGNAYQPNTQTPAI